jgi:undecaprenyl-diphosphatase
LNKYFALSIASFTIFIIISGLVSPRITNYNNSSPITKVDYAAFLFLNDSHFSPAFNKIMILLTQYGREVFWPVTIILLFIFGGLVGKKAAVIIAVSMLVLVPMGILAKDIVARPRPEIPKSDFLIAADKEYAFPSGHAIIVSAGAAGALALFRGTNKKLAISVLLAIESAFVCISRVYVGSHYPLDVIGGVFLGVGVCYIFVGIEKRLESLIMPIKKMLGR